MAVWALPLLATRHGAAQEVIPDFYREPGVYPTRDYVNQHVTEHIDPFTGSLQIHSTDLFIPGNGGFDLKLVRSFNSSRIEGSNPAAAGTQTLAGLGWTVHFGRALRKGADGICTNSNIGVSSDNGVIEMPDGSRQTLFFTNSTPMALTAQRWRVDCILTGNQGLSVYSPDGVRYDMDYKVNEVAGSPTINVWYTTRITDRNGNWASIAYVAPTPVPRIGRVTTSDGRTLTFTYNPAGLIDTITGAPGQVWRYGYQPAGASGRQFLVSVVRPDGTAWSYSHNAIVGPDNAGNYQLRQITYPQGGTISYGYQFVHFDRASNPLARSVVVSTKATGGGPHRSPGSWTFTYEPGLFGTLDRTTVVTPGGPIVYRHFGATTVASGDVWKIGLLAEKSSGTDQSEVYVWEQGNRISTEHNVRPGAFFTKVDLGGVFPPRLARRTINRNGTIYEISFANPDAYDNAQTVAENGPNGGSRSVALQYYVNAAKWIIRQVSSETVTRAGSSAAVSRTWDGSGNLASETRDGVVTQIVDQRTAAGDILRIRHARGLVTQYTNYHRGVPREELQEPNGTILITRSVDDAGNVLAERNGRGHTTHFSYDGLNRLRTIQPPRGAPTTIDYTATTASASRGAPALVETTTYDGFGRIASVTVGGITSAAFHDALGRKVFQSYPGSAQGTQFEYDLLDRVRLLTHTADGSTMGYSYGGSQVAVRDERNFTTLYSYRAYGDPDRQYLMSVTTPATSPDVSAASMTIERENARDLVTAVTQDGVRRAFGYDARHFLTSAVHPETLTTIFGRDDAGNMTSKRVGASGDTVYGYDRRNRLDAITYPTLPNTPGLTTPNVAKTYTNTHKIQSIATSAASRTYDYDFNDNLTVETLIVDGATFQAGYAYTDKDQLSSITYPQSSHGVALNPDVLGRPTTVGSYVSDVRYWPSGQVNTVTYQNGTVSTYPQDARLRPSGFRTTTGSITHTNQTWNYDAADNLHTVTDTVDPQFNRALGYDAIDRLTTANGPWGSGSVSYTGSGNIRSMAMGSVSIGYVYTNQLLTATTGSRPTNYSYDSYGNAKAANAITYDYDDAPNLRCVSCSVGNRVDYGYDGMGTRVWTQKAGHRTYEFWNTGGLLLSEFTPSQATRLREYFYLAGKRVAQRTTDSRLVSSTALTIAPNPVLVNQTVTLTATVTGGQPSGTVTFRESGVYLGSVELVGGTAILSTRFGTRGTRRIVAEYSGNATTGPSLSAPASLDVNTVNTTTTMTLTPPPNYVHLACVQTRVTVTGASPTGVVTLTRGTGSETKALVGGSAVFGEHQYLNWAPPPRTVLLTASYSGDAVNEPSTAQTTIVVNPPATGYPPPTWVPCRGWYINNPAPVSATRMGAGPISGSTTVSATGAVPPLVYSWNQVSGSPAISVSGAQTATFSAMMPESGTLGATFRVIVTDAAGDSGSVEVPVTFTSASALNVTVSPSPLYAHRTGPGSVTASATAAASGGTGSYTYSWTQLGGSNFTIGGAGTATVTLTGTAYARWCDDPIPTEGTFRVTARDTAGQTASRDLLVRFFASPAGRPPFQCP